MIRGENARGECDTEGLEPRTDGGGDVAGRELLEEHCAQFYQAPTQLGLLAVVTTGSQSAWVSALSELLPGGGVGRTRGMIICVSAEVESDAQSWQWRRVLRSPTVLAPFRRHARQSSSVHGEDVRVPSGP